MPVEKRPPVAFSRNGSMRVETFIANAVPGLLITNLRIPFSNAFGGLVGSTLGIDAIRGIVPRPAFARAPTLQGGVCE
jgi:hypothetical protein